MYPALAATSETLRYALERAMLTDIGPGRLAEFFGNASTLVSNRTPRAMQDSNEQGLSVWLYRITRDENRLNDPPRQRVVAGGRVELLPPPLPLRLHYLVTPIATNAVDTEQRILGRALQTFHATPLLGGAALRGELGGTDAEIHVHLEALNLEDMTRVWEALTGAYRLAVSYEVSLACIDSDAVPTRAVLVESVRPELVLRVATESA